MYIAKRYRKDVRTFVKTALIVFLLMGLGIIVANGDLSALTNPSGPDQPVPTVPAGNPVDIAPTSPASGRGSGDPTAVEVSRQTIQDALKRENFSYVPANMVDPFVPFITPQEVMPVAPAGAEEADLPPEMRKPVTPLQKMSVAEIEKGLRAITWGGLGRRAVIEDGAGKGYIVEVGTPTGDHNGLITEIFNDRIVIQQEFWDKKLKQMIPQNFVVKLKKVQEK